MCRSFCVLVYHRVAAPTCDPWALAVTPEHFDEQLTALDELGTMVPLAREARRRRASWLGRRRRRFAVTFDDGYVDNLSTAIPILERHDTPVTIFITTGFLDQPSFWWDRLSALVFNTTASAAEVANAAARLGLLGDDDTVLGDRHALHLLLWDRLAWRERSEIDALLDQLAAELASPRLALDARPMTTEELIELARHPLVSLGAHTADHRRLAWLDEQTAWSEMVAGAAKLDALVGPARRSFAYPFGEAGRRMARTARRAGFDHAVTTRSAWVSAFDGRRLLPRLHAPDVDGAVFTRWLLAI